MNITPLLVVLLGVVTRCGCYRSYSVNFDYPLTRRVDNFYPRDRTYDHGYRIDRGQVELTAHGVMPPAFLPRHEDGSLNLEIIPEYAEFLLRHGIRAVEIFSNDGEGFALTMEERIKVIDKWVGVGKKYGIHIMVQVGGVPYPQVIATAQHAQAAGADSILTLPDIYYKPATIEALVQFIDEVGKAAPRLPVLYYHYPSLTGVVFPPQDIVKNATARVPNFRGIKYDSNDLSQLTATLKEIKHGQELFLAADRLIAPGTLLGVRSPLSGTINFWPLLAREIFEAVQECDFKKAQMLQEKLTSGFEAIAAAGNIISALKAAMEIVTGIKVGPPGPPLPMITVDAKNKLERQLKGLGLVHNH